VEPSAQRLALAGGPRGQRLLAGVPGTRLGRRTRSKRFQHVPIFVLRQLDVSAAETNRTHRSLRDELARLDSVGDHRHPNINARLVLPRETRVIILIGWILPPRRLKDLRRREHLCVAYGVEEHAVTHAKRWWEVALSGSTRSPELIEVETLRPVLRDRVKRLLLCTPRMNPVARDLASV